MDTDASEGPILWPPRWPLEGEMTPDVESAQTAVNETLTKHVLTVTCRSCTKQEQFTGDTKYDAIVNARLAGWVYDIFVGRGSEICPAVGKVTP